MVDLNAIVQGLSRSGAVSGFAGGLAGTAVAGALTGKKGRKFAKSALKVGALAAVGGLAYTAYQRFRQTDPGDNPASGVGGLGRDMHPGAGSRSQAPANPVAVGTSSPAPVDRWAHIDRERFETVITDSGDRGSGGLLLVRAMIAAAAADGHLDRGEQARIFDETHRLDLGPEEKAALFDELRAPLRLDQLVAQVTNPETAVEIYAASLVAIDETRVEGQAYLRKLAAALGLPEALVGSVHEQAELARRDEAA
jgi:uncharacterized membrane protein YebE (DUF533 family)